jgi:hypothetical protein
MADLITLNCPTCGGNLQVTNDVERFVCAHCGNAHIVDPGVRVESLAAEVSELRAESNVRRLQKQMLALQEKRDQLANEVALYRQRSTGEWLMFRGAGAAAIMIAISASVSFIQELINQRYGIALIALAGIVLLLFIARKLMRQKMIFYTDPLTDVVEGISDMDRQIAQLQSKIRQEEQQILWRDSKDIPKAKTELPLANGQSLSAQ